MAIPLTYVDTAYLLTYTQITDFSETLWRAIRNSLSTFCVRANATQGCGSRSTLGFTLSPASRAWNAAKIGRPKWQVAEGAKGLEWKNQLVSDHL